MWRSRDAAGGEGEKCGGGEEECQGGGFGDEGDFAGGVELAGIPGVVADDGERCRWD